MALALMVMVTLTIVGLMSINDTVMESTVARNHTFYRQSLYLAEAAARQATQMMEDYGNDNARRGDLNELPSILPWVRHKEEMMRFGANVDMGDFRGDDGAVDYGTFSGSLLAAGNNNASGFLVRYDGVDPGDPLSIPKANNKFRYTIWGRGVSAMRNDATEVIIQVGYTMRY